MNYPEYVIIDNEEYKINTDFRIAIECNRIAEDEEIGDYERALAIIYTLFGDKGLENKIHHEELLKYAKKYLACGKDININQKEEEKDMDFILDMPYIEASFMSDFHIDLEGRQMHWWKFYNLLNGLSSSELGNSCILNTIRAGRRYDPKEIQDSKKRQEFIEWQKSIALPKKKKAHTKEQKETANKVYELFGLRKE